MVLDRRPSHIAARLATLGTLLLFALALGGGLLAGCAAEDQQFVHDIEDELREPDPETPRTVVERARDYLELSHVSVAPHVVRAVAGIAGVVLLLVGWKVYRLVVALPGLLVGALLGARLGASGGALVALLGLVAGAGIGAVLALVAHDVLVFGGGAYLGATLALGLTDWNPTLIIILGGLIGGTLTIIAFYVFLLAVTATIGALLLGGALGASPAVIAVLAAAGIIVQYNVARALGERPILRRRPRPLEEPSADE